MPEGTDLSKLRVEQHSLARRAESTQSFDSLAWFVLAVVGVLVVATFRDYGIPWDGQGEAVFGGLLLKYYESGFRDLSAFQFVNFRFYGGGFELPAAILSRSLPFGEYATRHLFNALLGMVGLAATWRLARTLGGARSGALAVLLLALNPGWYGNAFINARDVPFAAGMTCCLLLSLRALDELPRITWRTCVLFGVALGLTVSVRVGGVLAFGFLLVPIALWLGARARSGAAPSVLAREVLAIGASLVQLLVIAYGVMVVFWPWALQSPLNPLRALLMFSHFPFDAMVLFEGKLVPAKALPASYLPVQFAVRAPESLLIGLAGAVIFGLLALRERRWSWLETRNLRIVTVVFAALFPFLYFALFRPVAYNGMRHFLFVIPTLSVLAALAFDRALSAPLRSARIALAFGLAIAGIAQARALVTLHPNQYTYFNAFVGGPQGAQGRYELDYWGTSLAEATHLLVHDLESCNQDPDPGQPPLRVYVCGNVWSASTYFPAWLSPVERLDQADFQIAINDFFCKRPPGSRPVAGVTRAGALLSWVDDLRPKAAAASGGLAQSHGLDCGDVVQRAKR
jgi:4-amino-4-deoxy-L-arabinose transferase-like glycosyltransferase